MNWDAIENNLDQYDGGVQEQLGMLTDHQLESVVGRHEPRIDGAQHITAIEDDLDCEPDDFADLDDLELETEEFPSRMQ
jgi:uncharacterized protein YjbJ (UPF0337 family)